MGRQELLQPCCSSRRAGSVPLGHDAVLTPLGQGTDGDRAFRAFPSSQPSEPVLSEDEEGHRGTVIAWTTPWHERGEEGRGFKAHLGCQRSEQRTLNWVGVMLGLLGEA